MKWMIASDLHGSYYYAQQLQQAFERFWETCSTTAPATTCPGITLPSRSSRC